MAVPGSGFTLVWSGVTLSTATPKTVAGIVTGANKPVNITEVSVSCDATSGNALVELVYGTNATAGTSTPTGPVQIRGASAAVEATTNTNYSAEPTVLTVAKKLGRFAMPGGPLVIQNPLGREPSSQVTAAWQGKFIGIRVTASTSVTNCDGHIEFEEA